MPKLFVPTKPSLRLLRDAYPLIVDSNINEPRFYVGETVYVSPTERLRDGDFAAVTLKNGVHGIGRIVRIESELYHWETLFAPCPEYSSFTGTVYWQEVKSCHKIIATTY